MSKVIFGDVVRRANTKEDRHNTDKIYYVGGEHIESNEVLIENRGLIEGSTIGPMFYFGFKAGDVLFVSRNPHLRKAGMVTFDGICSEKTFVLETKDESVLLQRYLAFVMQSDHFWSYMEAHKSGSVNFFINWSTLEKYEFDLPDIEKQKSLSDMLWAINTTKNAYRNLTFKIDALIKSEFLEQFGSPVSLGNKWEIKTIGEVTTTQLGKMLNTKKQTGTCQRYYLANRNVQWFRLDFEDLRMMDFDETERKKYQLQDNDLLVCEGGEIGRCAIWHNEIEDCYIQNAVHRVRCNKEEILPLFLGHILYYHAQENGFEDIVGSKSTIAHLPADKLNAMKIFVPPIELQKKFEEFARKCNDSKLELSNSISNLIGLERSILSENFN